MAGGLQAGCRDHRQATGGSDGDGGADDEDNPRALRDVPQPLQARFQAERQARARVRLKRILPALGDLAPELLKQSDVDAFAASELKRGMTTKTVNNRLGVLSSLSKYATGEKTKFRFKVSGMSAEIHAVDPLDVERLLAACKDDR